MNGANYQRSGKDPLRSNPKSVHATQIDPKLPSGENVGGTKSPRVHEVTLRATQLTTPRGDDNAKPSKVDSFSGKGV